MKAGIHAVALLARTARISAAACLIGIAATITAFGAHAQNYPAKPIRFIVPYPPGGGTDIVARLIAAKMGQSLGQQVLVENKSGASTIIGSEALAKAAPDGYTIGMITDSHIYNPLFISKLPYDSEKDFQPISQLTFVSLMLVANPSLHVKTVQELVALAKSKPGKLSYASIGDGTPHQIAMEWLKSMSKIDLTHVPYRGVAPALTDVVAGQVDVMFTGTSSAKPYIDAGKLVALAVSPEQRLSSFPAVPTVAESGFPGYDFLTWYGLAAPAGTPRPIVERLSREVAAAFNHPEVKERLAMLGVAGAPSSPEEFDAFMKREADKMARIVKAAGLKPQ